MHNGGFSNLNWFQRDHRHVGRFNRFLIFERKERTHQRIQSWHRTPHLPFTLKLKVVIPGTLTRTCATKHDLRKPGNHGDEASSPAGRTCGQTFSQHKLEVSDNNIWLVTLPGQLTLIDSNWDHACKPLMLQKHSGRSSVQTSLKSRKPNDCHEDPKSAQLSSSVHHKQKHA